MNGSTYPGPGPDPARGRKRDRERGSVTLEVAVLAPVLLAVLGFAVLVGRFEVAAAAVEQASASAARAASLARTPAAARQAADRVATDSLRDQGLHCVGLAVTVDTAGFARPAGESAQVAATVTCTLDLADLVPGTLGSRRLTARTVSVLDTYRSR